MSKIAPQDADHALRDLPGWSRDGETLRRTYHLPGFRAALAFVQYVGEVAEALGHHPDIDVRYDRVTLAVTTHDAGGLTAKDLQLARTVDGVSDGGES